MTDICHIKNWQAGWILNKGSLQSGMPVMSSWRSYLHIRGWAGCSSTRSELVSFSFAGFWRCVFETTASRKKKNMFFSTWECRWKMGSMRPGEGTDWHSQDWSEVDMGWGSGFMEWWRKQLLGFLCFVVDLSWFIHPANIGTPVKKQHIANGFHAPANGFYAPANGFYAPANGFHALVEWRCQ